MSWTEQPCIVTTSDGQSGDVRSQVCQKTDAINFMKSISEVATATSGPFPGATLLLIQAYGSDQNMSSVVAGYWKNKWIPIDTDLTENPYQPPTEDIWTFPVNELRRMWQIYILKEGIVSQNPCFSVVETYLWTQNQSLGSWQYLPTPGAELFKTLQWIPA